MFNFFYIIIKSNNNNLNYDHTKNYDEDPIIKKTESDENNNQDSENINKREIIDWNFSCLDNIEEDCNFDSDEFTDDKIINSEHLGDFEEVVSTFIPP